MHYNEFQAVKLARQLIENEEDDDDAGGGDGSDSQMTGDQSQPPDESISSEATADSVQATGDSGAAGQMSTEDFVWLHVCVMLSAFVDECNCASQTVKQCAYSQLLRNVRFLQHLFTEFIFASYLYKVPTALLCWQLIAEIMKQRSGVCLCLSVFLFFKNIIAVMWGYVMFDTYNLVNLKWKMSVIDNGRVQSFGLQCFDTVGWVSRSDL